MLPASIWLAVVGTFVVYALEEVYTPGEHLVPGLLALGAVVVAPGFVVVRDLRRVFWLRAVTQGRAPGWAVLVDAPAAPPALRLTSYARRISMDAVLVRRRDDGRKYEPFARVPREMQLATTFPAASGTPRTNRRRWRTRSRASSSGCGS